MNQDTMHEVNNFIALKPVEFTADDTEVGAIIDTFGYESFTFLLQVGTITTGTLTPLLESSSSATFASDVNAIADDNLLGTEAGAAFGVADDDTTSKIGVINLGPTQRYIRLSVVGTDTSVVDLIGAQCIKGHCRSDDTYITQKPMG